MSKLDRLTRDLSELHAMYPPGHVRREEMQTKILAEIEKYMNSRSCGSSERSRAEFEVYKVTGEVPTIVVNSAKEVDACRVPKSPQTVAFLARATSNLVPEKGVISLMGRTDREKTISEVQSACCPGCRERIYRDLGRLASVALLEQITSQERKLAALVKAKKVSNDRARLIVERMLEAIRSLSACDSCNTPEAVERLFRIYVGMNNDILHLVVEGENRFRAASESGIYMGEFQ